MVARCRARRDRHHPHTPHPDHLRRHGLRRHPVRLPGDAERREPGDPLCDHRQSRDRHVRRGPVARRLDPAGEAGGNARVPNRRQRLHVLQPVPGHVRHRRPEGRHPGDGGLRLAAPHPVSTAVLPGRLRHHSRRLDDAERALPELLRRTHARSKTRSWPGTLRVRRHAADPHGARPRRDRIRLRALSDPAGHEHGARGLEPHRAAGHDQRRGGGPSDDVRPRALRREQHPHLIRGQARCGRDQRQRPDHRTAPQRGRLRGQQRARGPSAERVPGVAGLQCVRSRQRRQHPRERGAAQRAHPDAGRIRVRHRGLHTTDLDRALPAASGDAARVGLFLGGEVRHAGTAEPEDDMTKHRGHSQRGTAFVYIGIAMFALVGFTGLAVDLGRGYVIKANLSKAVDAAALAAARGIGEGESAARALANNIFNVNFPNGYLGVTSVQNPPQIAFSDASDQSSVITVSSRAVMPTTFMQIAGFAELGIAAQSQATRRLVDLSFVLDRSNSLASDFDQVKAAAEQFVSYFDPDKDRVALMMFATSTVVMDPINTGSRGFNKSTVLSHISGSTTGVVSTATAEGLYAGWDQLRSVTSGSQSVLRVIVLFTDGGPNTFSGQFSVKPCHGCAGALVPTTGALFTYDYPPPSGTINPAVTGLGQIYGTPSDASLHYVQLSPPTGGTGSNYT